MRLLREQGAPWGPESPAASAVEWARCDLGSGGQRCPLVFLPHIITPNLCGQRAQGDHSVGAIGAWGIETLAIGLAASI